MFEQRPARRGQAWAVAILLGVSGGGCASMGPVSTPGGGVRWLGPADPIAASRPAAVTFDPTQSARTSQTPTGLARYFPGQRGAASPSIAGAAPSQSMASRPAEPTAAGGAGPVPEPEGSPEAVALNDLPRPGRRSAPLDPTLPVGLVLETYRSPVGSSDPQARLASQRTSPASSPGLIEGPADLPDFSAEAASPGAASSSPESRRFIAGPPDLPDFGGGSTPVEDQPEVRRSASTEAPPNEPKEDRPGWVSRLRNRLGRPGLLGKDRGTSRVTIR